MHTNKYTDTSCVFLATFKDFGLGGVPVGTIAKRMMGRWSENVIQLALLISWSFPLPLAIIFHPHAFPAHFSLSLEMVQSDYADVSKLCE